MAHTMPRSFTARRSSFTAAFTSCTGMSATPLKRSLTLMYFSANQSL